VFRVKKEPKYDTAGSAKYIKEEGLKDCAAIASDLAAEIYGMDILEAGIEVGSILDRDRACCLKAALSQNVSTCPLFVVFFSQRVVAACSLF
jgi:hypothetical protein